MKVVGALLLVLAFVQTAQVGTNDADDSSELKIGASGMLVEALQRTLNQRTAPSPGLSVDGEFGPMTEGAVTAFQKAKGLAANGVVGPETWKALGPLVAEEPKVEESALGSVDGAKAPPESLNGPPLVTCKAWAIADGNTGKLLWGQNAEQPIDVASTTKIMTAYLICKYAEAHPEALDERITFSKRADETIGSTAALRTGEVVPARELLYGLLLPSGNDASVAFAEHFGGRMGGGDGDPSAKESPKESYDAFIDAMNSAANDLGMEHSHFVNTHGLTDDAHKASAADMLKLAHRAMELPLFREVVATSQHGCTVDGPGGYQRKVVWKNTNRLLGIEGYDGVKTGTTDAAGACLVSRGTHRDRSLLVAVFGAASNDSRYIDSRNLFRWAWSRLAAGDEGDSQD